MKTGRFFLGLLTILSGMAFDRAPVGTSNFPATTPEVRFTTTSAFPGLTFAAPVALVTPPGETNRLFVVEKGGRIMVITNLAQPTKTTFLNIAPDTYTQSEGGTLGLAFHPGYATNGYFYLFYTANKPALEDRLSRFKVSETNPNLADRASEVILFSQPDQAGNHNGGDIHFGPDGYLYVSLGDEGGGNDQYNNSQLIDKDLFAGILRIDVDRREGNLDPNPHPAIPQPFQYAIPADNPFVGVSTFNGRAVNPANVRTEFWAVGLRNPWRMAFDGSTLYAGDVGQNALEEVDVIVKGGNYGWAYREGTRNGPKAAPAGFTSIPPIAEYGRSLGVSITGGRVYRGRALSELRGKYIFTDYSSGRIWAGTPNGTNTMPYTQIATDAGIVGFGEDPRNRDLLMADINDGSIRKLIYAADTGSAPATLGASGLFTNTAALSPASGVHPYEVALPYWTDGLQKRRWFSIPSSLGSIQPSETNWSFPNGSVWVQHFDLETTNGVPESKRPVETRVLVKSSDGIYGLSYRWAPGANEATLVGPGGEDAEIQVSSNGVASSLRWRFPARSECLRCHSAAAGYAIGFQPWQLNRQADVHGQQAHQIAALLEEDYFITSPTNIHLSKRPEAPENQSVSVEYRARSWLAANCAHCHQPGGNGPGAFDLRLALTTEQTGMINGSLREPKGDRRVIVPGSLENSELYQRLIIEGPGHMPPLDSRIPDPAGVALIAQWITNDLPSRPFYGNWLTNYFAIQTSAEAAPFADPDLGGVNYLEFLTGTNPTNNASAWGIRIEKEDEGTAMGIRFDHLTNRLFELQVTQSLTNGMWRALDMPENTPYAPAQPIERVIVQPATNRMEFYRVSVFEP